MPNVIVPDRPAKDVILIDGICYKLVGPTSNPKTHEMSDIDGQFDSCPECEAAEKSDLSSSSSSSGPAPPTPDPNKYYLVRYSYSDLDEGDPCPACENPIVSIDYTVEKGDFLNWGAFTDWGDCTCDFVGGSWIFDYIAGPYDTEAAAQAANFTMTSCPAGVTPTDGVWYVVRLADYNNPGGPCGGGQYLCRHTVDQWGAGRQNGCNTAPSDPYYRCFKWEGGYASRALAIAALTDTGPTFT